MSGWGIYWSHFQKVYLNTISTQCFPNSSDTVLINPIPSTAKGSYSTRRIWACTQALVTGSSDHYLHTIFTLIKTITKFSNVIGCHQPDLSTNRTVDTSCLCKWTVSDVVAHFAELIVVFLMKTYNWCLFSLSNFVIVLTNCKQEFKSSNSICDHTRN